MSYSAFICGFEYPLHSNLVIFKYKLKYIAQQIGISSYFTFQSGDIQIKDVRNVVNIATGAFTFQSGDIQIFCLTLLKYVKKRLYIPIW